MAQEIERKFLVDSSLINLTGVNSYIIVQGYLSNDPKRTVRIRVSGLNGFITIKGETNESGLSRFEWEKQIPLDEALELLQLCEKTVNKTRYIVPQGEHKIEVDVFMGDNDGLIIAEVELETEDDEFNKPIWLLEEVTGDKRYYNLNLALNPYKNW